MIPLFKPVFDKEMQEAAIHSMNNEKFVMGESVFKFEEEFARYCGTDFAISASSGTDALHLTMEALAVKGGEVITTPASFVATANSVIHAGAKPVFSDCSWESRNLDPARIAVGGKTRAILPVHLYGNPCDADAMNEVASKHSLPVIEDACQAHGARYKGRRAGNLATAGCFSFYSTKNMTVCGDGGMITTNDKALADRIAKLRNCGRISQYEHDEIGYTSRLNTANAAIGRVQLRRLDGWNERRQAIAKRYLELLAGIEGLGLPHIESHSESVFHLFALTTPRRDALAEHLKKDGIQTGMNFPIPIHLQPIYRKLYGHTEGQFPNAERLSREVVCIPMFVDISDEEINAVADSVRRFFG